MYSVIASYFLQSAVFPCDFCNVSLGTTCTSVLICGLKINKINL